jgi:tRNA dimethylallyltransferase
MAATSPLIVVVGETASGKTELAIRLAEHFNGEIICADAWTIRRQADIGTAKPTAEEQARARHHLIDVIDPDEEFSAAAFQSLAEAAILDIHTRGKLPIMVGGTGLYVDSVIYNYQFLPPADAALRAELDSMTITELLQRIEKLGLELGSVDTANKRRLVRLIETNGVKAQRHPLRDDTLVLGLQPDRTTLKQRIIDRVDAQLAAGLEDEVRSLVERCGWKAPALKGIAYAQWQGYFSGNETLDEVRQSIIRANFDYAKRQRTWFRRNKSIRWLPTPVNWVDTVDLVTTHLHANVS